MRKSQKGGYLPCDTGYLEVRVPETSGYEDVAHAAAETVDLENLCGDGSEDSQLLIIRANKTIVPNRPLQVDPESGRTLPWTIANYLSTFPSFRRSRQPIKLGVGYGSELATYTRGDRGMYCLMLSTLRLYTDIALMTVGFTLQVGKPLLCHTLSIYCSKVQNDQYGIEARMMKGHFRCSEVVQKPSTSEKGKGKSKAECSECVQRRA